VNYSFKGRNLLKFKPKISVTTKILSSTTVLNIDDNKKCYLSQKSAY